MLCRKCSTSHVLDPVSSGSAAGELELLQRRLAHQPGEGHQGCHTEGAKACDPPSGLRYRRRKSMRSQCALARPGPGTAPLAPARLGLQDRGGRNPRRRTQTPRRPQTCQRKSLSGNAWAEWRHRINPADSPAADLLFEHCFAENALRVMCLTRGTPGSSPGEPELLQRRPAQQPW